MKTTSALIKLLIFAAVTMVVTAVLIATVSNIELGRKTRYHALFSDAFGPPTWRRRAGRRRAGR